MNCTIKDGKYLAPNGEESLLYKNLREVMSEAEANDIFVLSKTPSFQERVLKPLIEAHRNKTLDIPTNIKFKETFTNKIRTFHIYDGKTKVGRIQLTSYKDGFKVKSSLINEDRRGEGNGKFLYNYAISKLLVENNVLYTDTARTEDADRVWESLKKQGLSQDGKSVKPLPKEFDKNGEISMSTVLQYTADNFSQTLPLNAVEKSHLINLQIEGVETSDDLYNVLYDAFYKNNLFSPNINKLKKIYSEDEIRNILEDSEIQGRVKETIEKLRQTEEFTIPQIKYNKDFDVRSSKVNIIGQYKKQNPLKLEQQVKEQDYVKVPVVNEAGEQLETQLFYENAIKVPSEKTIRAVNAVVNAHSMVDTTTLENKLIKTFKNYGMDIEGIERENFKELLDYVTEPIDENRKALEDVLGFVRQPLTKPINISPENRSYQYLKTAKSEQELFDEMSLIQTTVPNVYHKINKIDEQEMRDIQENQDLTVPDYQLYKDYYGYGLPSEIEEVNNSRFFSDFKYRLKLYKQKGWDVSNENKILFRSGDLVVKAEDAFIMKGSRGSGHFGTGFYFFGGAEAAKNYDKRNVSIINTENYSLIQPKNYIDGLDLHQALKEINNFYYKNNEEAIAEDIVNNYELPFYEYKDKIDFVKFDKYIVNNKQITDYLINGKQKSSVDVFENRRLTDEILQEYKNAYENEVGKLYNNLKKSAESLKKALSKVGVNVEATTIIKKVQNYSVDEYSESSRGKDTLGTEILKDLGYEGIFVKGMPELDNSLYGNVIFDVKDGTSFTLKEEQSISIEPIQTNIQTESEYLLNDFVADFAAEKLKNPTEFNRQFKITETGIEIASKDTITLETVKAYIQDGAKYSKEIADYSLLSKDMPNLKEKDSFTVESVQDKRIKAVNDINSVSKPTTEITIIDEESFSAPNETNQFLRINNNVFEQQEQGYYNKLQKNTNPNFFDLNPQAPEFKNFDIQQEERSENKSRKLLDKETDNENFSCI